MSYIPIVVVGMLVVILIGVCRIEVMIIVIDTLITMFIVLADLQGRILTVIVICTARMGTTILVITFTENITHTTGVRAILITTDTQVAPCGIVI